MNNNYTSTFPKLKYTITKLIELSALELRWCGHIC